MQIKHLVGVVALISILSASFAGFGIAHFEYQPQIENMKTELSQLNSTLVGLQSNVSALTINNDILKSENAELNSTVTILQSTVSALETKFDILNETATALSNYVDNISLITDSSYYIFKQNSTYYAKSGLTGQIECHNDSCSVVINYTLTHVPFGGAVLFGPLASADDAYYVDSTIYPPSGTTLASENRMVTICLKTNSAVQTVIDMYNVHDVHIRDIGIYSNNKSNNTSCNGIIIDSNYSYDSNILIENLNITNCTGTGIWITQYPTNNVVRNVQVFDSGVYNIEVDSASNQFINVESGWAGLSGFDVPGVDNYFLNCISWGCGQNVEIDGNGFYIFGARNMFVGCDAGANFQGGFVLANANQCMLESCVGRDNGLTNFNNRIPGRWGFALWNTNSTILGGCLSTDENDNKTQDYGFTEDGNSDYNTVTDCNFEGNRVGAVSNLVGIHSVITDTAGYETKNVGYTNFRYTAEPIDISTNKTYGTPKNFTSETGTIGDFHVTIQLSGISLGENVTVMVQALLENGTTTSLEISRNTNSTYILTQADASELWSNNTTIQKILISAKTTENTTLAEVVVFVWGSGN